ncbi:MAG: dihydrodipicolinate synthase family protein [Alphaproteobacteria bacterium]
MSTDRTALPRGVFAATLTPLDESLAPDHTAFLAHARWLLARGCDGLAPLGTTGEANSLTVDQRLALIELATAELPAKRLLVGTGSCALGDAVRLTRASLAGGVSNVLVLPPFYYKPLADDGAFRFFAGLIDAVGDAGLRVHLYNFPQLTGFHFGHALIDRLSSRYGPVIAGMKDSSGDWENMRATCRSFPDLAVYAGTERLLLDILNEDGAGCISATANVTATLCQAVYRSWLSVDGDAESLQATLSEWRGAIERYPVVPALKSLMGHVTGAPVWRNILPPLSPLPERDGNELKCQLEALGPPGVLM